MQWQGYNEFLGSTKRLQTSFDVHSEYLGKPGMAKTYAGLRVQPGQDRYFEAFIVDDPKGVVEETNTVTSGGGTRTNVTEVKTFRHRTKWSAIFAKNFYNFTIKRWGYGELWWSGS